MPLTTEFRQGACGHDGGVLSHGGVDYCPRCFEAGEKKGFEQGLRAAAQALQLVSRSVEP